MGSASWGGVQFAAQFGRSGVIYTDDTTEVSDQKIYAIQAIEDATFTSLTELACDGDMAGATLTAGMMILGQFTGYQLSSGSVRAYLEGD